MNPMVSCCSGCRATRPGLGLDGTQPRLEIQTRQAALEYDPAQGALAGVGATTQRHNLCVSVGEVLSNQPNQADGTVLADEPLDVVATCAVQRTW